MTVERVCWERRQDRLACIQTTIWLSSGPTRSVDSNYPFARHCKHLTGAGRASAANQVTVTLYRGVLGSSDLQKVETFRTGIDGLYHFENIPKGQYTIHVQDPNLKEPNWGPAAYRHVSVTDDNAVIELDPTIIDYK